MIWRNSLEAARERRDRVVAPPTVYCSNPDLRHCLAVVRANGGYGFPFASPTPSTARDAAPGNRPAVAG